MEQTKKRKKLSPLMRHRRKQGKLLTWVLLGTIGIFLVLGLLVKDRAFSESENRKLAGFPEFSFSGKFLTGLSDYMADQFPGRDFWITVNLKMNQFLGQQESGGVYLCADDYLMQIPDAPNQEALDKNLAAIDSFRGKYPDLNMVMTVVPNAVTILSEKLPENAPVRNQMEDLAYIKSNVHGVNFVDVTGTLLIHNDEQLYYRTDHHWTSLAASYAYATIAEAMDIPVPGRDTYRVYPVSDSFQGTLSSRSGSHKAEDVVEVYAPLTDVGYCVTYPDSAEPVGSMYNRAALEGKDHYTVFFGGNYSRVDITTTASTGRSLLLFKDSYANCMVQFLYPYFEHITMIDPRYYYDNLETAIRTEGITDVLFLYNCDTFLGDTSLADVLLG